MTPSIEQIARELFSGLTDMVVDLQPKEDRIKLIEQALRSVAPQWRPIETAPKDGTFFSAIMGVGNIPFVTAYDEDDQDWFTFNLQYENVIGKRTGKKWQPTQWMPLFPVPTPPKSGEQDE